MRLKLPQAHRSLWVSSTKVEHANNIYKEIAIVAEVINL